MMGDDFHLEINGYCPICEAPATFVATDKWLRDSLICQSCENGSGPRERALAYVLNRSKPNWRKLKIHESSPVSRGISVRMQMECPNYTASHYFPEYDLGTHVDGIRNESLEAMTFADESFDIIITLDVFEHVYEPGKMIKEIFRTLKPGGAYICTFPIRKYQTESHKPRAQKENDGSITYIEKPEIHGNPISGAGALVTFDYGYDIHSMLAYWSPFRVEVSRFSNRDFGILGEYTEVIVCERPTMGSFSPQ